MNKVVLITGASRGVGLATANLLAENGFIVYGTVRPGGPPVCTTNNNLQFLPVHLKDSAEIQTAVAQILSKEGHLDILINNAGYGIAGPIESLTDEEMQEQMDINFFAPIRFIQAVLPTMRDHKTGHIINISSINAIITPPFGSMYAASKSALESVSESLCIEVAPYNIFVSIVEPGLLSTHFSILTGSREILNDPYQPIMDAFKTELNRRMEDPESLYPSQSPKEIAQFLFNVITDAHPKLRYQTSEDAKQVVSKKLVDLTGSIYIEEMNKN